MAPDTKVNGMKKPIKEMVEDTRYGLMVLYMKDIGKTIRLMDVADLSMLMETFTKVIGRMTRLMDLENTCILMALNTKESGEKTNNMGKVKKHGPMVLVMKEIT